MGENLSSYVPDSDLRVKIEFHEELAPAIEHISKVLPTPVIWDIFSSTPSETSGKIIFPYSRVDNAVIIPGNTIYLLEHCGDKYNAAEYRKKYDRGCIQAFEALVWVEIGFGGLQNLAKSPASRNWTSAVSHFVDDKQREMGIMTTGKDLYVDCLSQFAEFRAKKRN